MLSMCYMFLVFYVENFSYFTNIFDNIKKKLAIFTYLFREKENVIHLVFY